MKYLGIPLKVGKMKKVDWMPLIDKVESSLPNWKGRFLSRGGRLVLINSVLSSIPAYWMSFFYFPMWVIKRIDKIRRAFFWSGKNKVSGIKCLSKWENLCRSKEQGGIGIINLHWQNIALLGKWLWKLLTNEENLWVKFIRNRFFRRRNVFKLSGIHTPGASSVFQDIWKHCKIFSLGIRKDCGKGLNVLFWKDLWIGEISLDKRFPDLFLLASDRWCTVNSS